MLSRASLLRRAVATVPRRYFADAAAVSEGNKLKLNFFLPHDSIKSNAEVVSCISLSTIRI